MEGFHYIKGLDFLLKSFNQLRKIRDDVHLVFMGKDDGYEKTMLKLINKMKLNSKITIIGFKSGIENSIVKESTICISLQDMNREQEYHLNLYY